MFCHSHSSQANSCWTVPWKSNQHRRWSSAEIPSGFKRETDRTDAPRQTRDKASDTSQVTWWCGKKLQRSGEALGCEQLCDGPKGGGQSREGWLKQELQMQSSAQVNGSDGILTPQADGRQATTLQTARFTSHWCCVHQALSGVFEFIPSKLKTQHLRTLEQKNEQAKFTCKLIENI